MNNPLIIWFPDSDTNDKKNMRIIQNTLINYDFK